MAIANLGNKISRRRQPDDACIVDISTEGSTTLSYADVFQQTEAVARKLQKLGFRSGTRIGIVAGNHRNVLISYLGIMRAGMCAVPVNYQLSLEALNHVFKDASIVYAFTDEERESLIPHDVVCQRLDLIQEWYDFIEAEGKTQWDFEQDGFANILYTSGSSGVPKGVPITHESGVAAIDALVESANLAFDDRCLVAAPLYHMNGLFFALMTIASGATLILMQKFTARSYLEVISGYRCTVLTSVPTMIALALREIYTLNRIDLSSVRRLVMGSAPVSEDMMKKVQACFPSAQIVNGYGTTESGPIAFAAHPEGIPTPWPSMGVASPRVQLKLTGPFAPKEGTLWIRSKMLMPGYLNRLDLTAARIIDGWYNTGDVMRVDDNGFYYFVGRDDDMFNCAGENIYPGEVERMLEKHPRVAQAVVVPVPDSIKGALPAAFIVLTPGESVSEAEIKHHALESGPAYQHPRFIQFLKALPLSGTNKIDRKKLSQVASAWTRN